MGDVHSQLLIISLRVYYCQAIFLFFFKLKLDLFYMMYLHIIHINVKIMSDIIEMSN